MDFHACMELTNPETEFQHLMRPHLDRLYRFAHRLTGTGKNADELIQDVLVDIYCRLEELCTIDKPAPWLCRIMYNCFLEDSRIYGRRRLVSVDEGQLGFSFVETLPGTTDLHEHAQRADDIMCLDRALSVLSDEQRLVVLLHDVERYKISEIRLITGEPVGTIRTRLRRARARLRQLLANDANFS